MYLHIVTSEAYITGVYTDNEWTQYYYISGWIIVLHSCDNTSCNEDYDLEEVLLFDLESVMSKRLF